MEMKKIKAVYPRISGKGYPLGKIRSAARGLVLLGGAVCLTVNALNGGSMWSIVVLSGCLLVMNVFLSPRLVERNLIGFVISLASYSCIVLFAIGWALSPGWFLFVIPIVCSGAIVISTVLFLTDVEAQKNSVHPSIILSFISLVVFTVGFFNTGGRDRLVMGISALVALTSLAVCASVLRLDFLRELKRRFHTR